MSMAPGTRIGPYEIVDAIGAGSMGEVYRAMDVDLRRAAAIKVLPPSLADDRDRLARFQREAEVLASLNHANIAHVYGLERSDGITAIAMELVEGPTLADRIAQGPVHPEEAVEIALQIANALEAAHDAHIVHRDLKPANIKLSPDGTVKVLDFGIAKALQPPTAAGDSPTPSRPVPAATEVGALLGTVAYMSPEQARGKAVDERADIWAFGCVLYEMLVGQPAFPGEDASVTLARVLEREAYLKALPGGVPPTVRHAIGLCLRKRINERIADIRDVKLALNGAFEMRGPPRPSRAGWFAAGAAVAIAAALAVGIYVKQPRTDQSLRLSMALPAGWSLATSSSPGEPTPVVVAPNGQRVAIVARQADGQTAILMREMDAASARPLAGTEGATSLFWSPDSGSIGFFADGKVETLDLSGGTPSVVCDTAAPFLGGTWGGSDTIVFSSLKDGHYKLWKVPVAGGQPTAVLPDTGSADVAGTDETRPWFLPDGKTLLFVNGVFTRTTAIYATELDSPNRVKVADAESSNVQYAEGRLLFLRGDALVAQAFDARRLTTTGEPVPLVGGVTRHGPIPGYGVFSASQNGVLAYYSELPTGSAMTLSWVDRQGRPLGTIGERANYWGVSLSHDQTRAVTLFGEQSDRNLSVIDLSNGVTTPLTFGGNVVWPTWSTDDRFIDFGSQSSGGTFGYRKPSNGAGAGVRILPQDDDGNLPFDEAGDGSVLFVRAGANGADLWVVPGTGDRIPYPLADTPDDKRMGRFSPDGRWVAYVSYDGRIQNIWIVPFLGRTETGGAKWRVSGSDGGVLPLWRADGHEIYYIASSGLLTAVPVDDEGDAPRLGPSKTLFPISVSRTEGGYEGWPYAVSEDGQRFLVISTSDKTPTDAGTAPLNIEINWAERLP